MAANLDEIASNTSILSDFSRMGEVDFNYIVESLLCKPKKSRRPKKSGHHHRKVQPAHSVPALNAADLLRTYDEPDNSAWNATISATDYNLLNNFSFNDTCTTINSEQLQLENIFAYFDQDVTTDNLLYSDDDDDDDGVGNEQRYNNAQIQMPLDECESLASNLMNLQLNDKSKAKKKQQHRQEAKDIQNKSKAILNKIQQFNGIEPKQNVGTAPTSFNARNRPVSVHSSSSTASLHDSDSDTIFKKPQAVPKSGNVRSKVAFFNDHSSSERSSSASPSVPSSATSDDEEFQFRRTKSKRDFKRNRDFFENFFKDKPHDQSISDTSTLRAETKLNNEPKRNGNFRQQNVNANEIDVYEKLQAVQTYVQTQYLLERIQRLVTAISDLDGQRLSSMNLKLLKKFLTFIRDCSYSCTEVCNTISQNVLTDFEKNVMSAEELLYTALKNAHSVQVQSNNANTSNCGRIPF